MATKPIQALKTGDHVTIQGTVAGVDFSSATQWDAAIEDPQGQRYIVSAPGDTAVPVAKFGSDVTVERIRDHLVDEIEMANARKARANDESERWISSGQRDSLLRALRLIDPKEFDRLRV